MHKLHIILCCAFLFPHEISQILEVGENSICSNEHDAGPQTAPTCFYLFNVKTGRVRIQQRRYRKAHHKGQRQKELLLEPQPDYRTARLFVLACHCLPLLLLHTAYETVAWHNLLHRC